MQANSGQKERTYYVCLVTKFIAELLSWCFIIISLFSKKILIDCFQLAFWLPSRRTRTVKVSTEFFFLSLNLACGEVDNFNYTRDVCRKRIIGGQHSSKGAYPWHVLLKRNGDVACGGSLLNEQWVLTG